MILIYISTWLDYISYKWNMIDRGLVPMKWKRYKGIMGL